MTTSMSIFTITIVGPNESFTNQLYANGNQQVTVTVNVTKTVDGVATPLSQSEMNSVTVAEYSSNVWQSMPTGWSCDTSQNQYDQGLRGGTSFAARQSDSKNDATNVIYRYLRANSGVPPLQNYQFMARITLDNGTTYTTHYDTGDVAFESKITISPQRPYVINVSELTFSREDAYHAEYKKNNAIDVDTYYWTLPSSLRVMSDYFEGQGYATSKLVYAYAINNDGNTFLGMAIHNYVTSLTLGDIGNLPDSSYSGTTVPLINSDRMMRGARYLCNDHNCSPTYDNYLYWSITDNLGCVSRFILKSNSDDHGNTMQLTNA